MKHVRLGRLGKRPALELLEEQQAAHRKQLLGRAALIGAEVLAEFAGGQEFEDDVAEDALPANADALVGHFRKDRFKRVEEACLSRVVDMLHADTTPFAVGY